MKAVVSYGLLALMVASVVAFTARGCGGHLMSLFRDEQMVCSCGSSDVKFRPTQAPPGATHDYFTAICQRCGQQWTVVDVSWSDPRKIIDATIEAQTHEPEYLDQ